MMRQVTWVAVKVVLLNKISEVEPRAVFSHWHGHALNLAAGDALKQCRVMRDRLHATQEITKLVKYSPRREEVFWKLKENSQAETSSGIRVLCPTRWPLWADSPSRISSNYDTLQSIWEEAIIVGQDNETKARIQGVSSQMRTFSFLYGCPETLWQLQPYP